MKWNITLLVDGQLRSPVISSFSSLLTFKMHQSIPSTNIPRWASPGVLHLLLARVPGFYHLNCPGVARGLGLSSINISNTKLSVNAELRHFFSFRLIYQLLQLFSKKICFKTEDLAFAGNFCLKEGLLTTSKNFPEVCLGGGGDVGSWNRLMLISVVRPQMTSGRMYL